jgi:hypothetical protein
MKDMTKEKAWKVFRDMNEKCIEEYRTIEGRVAERSARCFLGLDRFEPTVFKNCDITRMRGGEELWSEACEHSVDLMAESPEMKDVPKAQLRKALQSASKNCLEEYAEVGGEAANESARCVLLIETFDKKHFGKCEPRKKGK